MHVLIANSICLWANTNGCPCKTHKGTSVMTMCYFPKTLGIKYGNSYLVNGLEFDHRTLCIDLKYMKRFECEQVVEAIKQLYLCINFDQAPDIPEDVLLQHGAPLECKWEASQVKHFSMHKKCFSSKHIPCKGIKECS